MEKRVRMGAAAEVAVPAGGALVFCRRLVLQLAQGVAVGGAVERAVEAEKGAPVAAVAMLSCS